MTTGKTIALTFVGKVMSLLLNMLSRLGITFLPRSKRLLISWLQSPSAVILEPRKIKSAIVSTVSPSICHEMITPYHPFNSSRIYSDFLFIYDIDGVCLLLCILVSLVDQLNYQKPCILVLDTSEPRLYVFGLQNHCRW